MGRASELLSGCRSGVGQGRESGQGPPAPTAMVKAAPHTPKYTTDTWVGRRAILKHDAEITGKLGRSQLKC